MSDITKPKDDALLKPKKFGATSSFGRKIEQAQEIKQERATVEAATVSTMPNRIGMMLDVSGSMSDKMSELKAAATAFIDACDAANTAVAINTFEPSIRINLSNAFAFHKAEIQTLTYMSGTPMAEAMIDMIHNESLTRCVLVSDGEPNDGHFVTKVANDYKEFGLPIDTVHIGNSESGEQTLRDIARITGGIYMKFRDVSQFKTAFKYLTPSYRAMLADPAVRKRLGAE